MGVTKQRTFLRGLLGVRRGLLLQRWVVGHCEEVVLVKFLERRDCLVD